MITLIFLSSLLFGTSTEDYQFFKYMEANEHPQIPNRLLDPSFSESIAHILMNPYERSPPPNAPEQLSEFIQVCLSKEFPDLFPRFLCALVYLYQSKNVTALPQTSLLFPLYPSAVRFLNDPENYPCHTLNRTDVVAISPYRIFSGCASDTDPGSSSTFDRSYVMDHPFPDVKLCSEIGNQPKCELRSLLVQLTMVFQQEDCCCDTITCATLVFSQSSSFTPIVMKTVDLRMEPLISPPKKRPKSTPSP